MEKLHRHRFDPSENDTDHRGGGRIQQHRQQQDRQYAESAQLSFRFARLDEKTGKAPGVRTVQWQFEGEFCTVQKHKKACGVRCYLV